MIRLKPTKFLALGLLTATMALPSAATASPLFEAMGSATSASGMNARFSSNSGASAAYFNPAMLTTEENSLEFGITVYQQSMNFTYGERGDVDISRFSQLIVPNDPDFAVNFLPTDILQNGLCGSSGTCSIAPRPRGGVNGTGDINIAANMGITINVIDKLLTAGFYAMLPLGTYTEAQVWYADERDQLFTNSLHAEMYEDRLRAPTLSIGLGSNPIDQLRFGVAFTLALKATATANAFAPAATNFEDTLELVTRASVIAKVAPHFSVVYEPIENLSLSLVAHSPSKFTIDTAFAVTILASAEDESSIISSTHDYMPWIVALGGEYGIEMNNNNRLDLSAGARIEMWSNYVDRIGRTPEDPYAWKNTVVPSLSAVFNSERATLGASGLFAPSPVPEQTGRTNYVDNDRLQGTLTGSYRFELLGLPMEVGAQVMGGLLFERTHTKLTPDRRVFSADRVATLVRDEMPDNAEVPGGQPATGREGLQTNNPGWPSFSSEGAMWSSSMFLRINY